MPDKIENTNRFASLLADLKTDIFVDNLILKIQEGVPGTTRWLADYMYALGCIFDDIDYYYGVDDNFAHKLGNWMLNTQGGEISWKSGIILSNVDNDNIFDYLETAVKDKTLFFMTRTACLERLISNDGIARLDYCRELLTDSNQDFVEYVREVIEDLEVKECLINKNNSGIDK